MKPIDPWVAVKWPTFLGNWTIGSSMVPLSRLRGSVVCVCPQVFNPENRSITVEKFSTEMLYDVPGRCFPMVTAPGFSELCIPRIYCKIWIHWFSQSIPSFFHCNLCTFFLYCKTFFFFRKHALLLGVKTKFCDAPTDIPQIWRGSVANCIDFGSVISPQNRRVFSLNHVNIFSEPPTRRDGNQVMWVNGRMYAGAFFAAHEGSSCPSQSFMINIMYDIWYMIYDIWYMIYDIWYMIWYMIWQI